jgi:hypothetical protein
VAEISSVNISIFPCVSRFLTNDNNEVAKRSKLMSEENITGIIKSITDKDSYVISYDGQVIKFVLGGYYIEVAQKLSDTVYAHLVFQKSRTNQHKLIAGDNNNNFYGVVFSNSDTAPTITDSYEYGDVSLKLYDGEQVPQTSFYKFNPKSINVDFGELN